MTEPCDLAAIEARRLIGSQAAVPGRAAARAASGGSRRWTTRSTPSRRATSSGPRGGGAAAEQAVMRGEPLPPLHGLPVAIKDLEDAEGLVNSQGSPIYRDDVSPRDQRSVAAVRARGGDHRRQVERAGVRRRREQPQPGLWRDRQSVRSDQERGRVVGRVGGGAGLRHGADRHRVGHGRQLAQPGGVQRHRRLPAHARPGRRREARSSAGRRCRVLGPMARTVPDAALLLSRHGERRQAGSAGDARSMGGAVRRPEDFYPLPELDLVVAAGRAHAGFRPGADRAAHRRGVRREDGPVPRRVRPGGGHAPGLHRRRTSRSRCCARSATRPSTPSSMRTRPEDLGPNIHANYEEALRYSAVDVGARAEDADRALPALAGVLRRATT